MLVLECDTNDGCDVRITPLQKNLRGTLDFQKVKEPNAMLAASEWRQPIPGMRLELDFAKGTAAVVEPLHRPEFAPLRKKLEKLGQGYSLLPEREEVKKFDAASWYFWATKLLDAGLVRIISGQLPEKAPPGEPVKAVVFRHRESKNDKRVDELSSAVASMAKTMNALMTITLAGLPEKQRQALLDQLGSK